MLSKKDKSEIRALFAEEFNKAMTRVLTIERGARKQGDPEKVVKEEEWNVIDFMSGYIPYLEGALRGVQTDVDSARNTSAKALEGIKAVAGILETTHKSIMTIANFASELEQLSDETQVVKITQDKMARALPLNSHLLDTVDAETEEVKE